MNNSENNNQENNEGLNAISLGNVPPIEENNIPTIDAVPPVEPIPITTDNAQLANEVSPVSIPVEAPPVAPVPMDAGVQGLVNSEEKKGDSNEIPQVVGETPQVIEPSVVVDGSQAVETNSNTEVPPVIEANLNTEAQPKLAESVVSSIPTDVPPVAPLSYDVPETINNFDPTPVFNNIGTVPPIPDIPVVDPAMQAQQQNEKKKGMPKILFILIVILALAAVGVGVYIFLHKSNILGSGVVPKNVKVEIGSKLSTNIEDYATFSSVDSSTCSLDIASIPATLETLNAEYTFRITCNQASYSGKLTVVDTIAPEVTLKEKLEVAINSSVKPEDFILECKDSTKCTYAFKDADKVKNNLKEASNYHVDIIIKDEGGNQVEKTATLIVSEIPEFEEADMYLSCSKPEENGMVDNTKIGVVDGEYKKGAVLKRYIFKVEASELESLKLANEGKLTMTYKNYSGQPTFDEMLVLSKPISYDNFKEEVGEDAPSTIGELRVLLTEKGYACTYEYE